MIFAPCGLHSHDRRAPTLLSQRKWSIHLCSASVLLVPLPKRIHTVMNNDQQIEWLAGKIMDKKSLCPSSESCPLCPFFSVANVPSMPTVSSVPTVSLCPLFPCLPCHSDYCPSVPLVCNYCLSLLLSVHCLCSHCAFVACFKCEFQN